MIATSLHCTKKLGFPINISFVNVNRSAGKLRMCSHLLKKFLMENFISCAVLVRYLIKHIDDLNMSPLVHSSKYAWNKISIFLSK